MVLGERSEARARKRRRALRREGEERPCRRRSQRSQLQARRLRLGDGVRRGRSPGGFAARESAMDGAGSDTPGVSGSGVGRLVVRLHGDRDDHRKTAMGGKRRGRAESDWILRRGAGVSAPVIGARPGFSGEVFEEGAVAAVELRSAAGASVSDTVWCDCGIVASVRSRPS